MLSILTLNLRFGLADDGPDRWSRRKKVFPSLLSEYGGDFLGFQEANDFQTSFLEEILHEYKMIGKRLSALPFWQNNILFYKKDWNCVYDEHFFLSPTPAIPSRSRKSRWPRQCTMGIFEKDGRRVICINTHFDFDAAVQIESAEIIMERLSHLPPDVPAFLIGDFNATPSRPCHTVFTGKDRKSMTKGLYFRNAFKEPFPGTYHRFTGNPTGDHIDWILYRGRISLKNAEVIRNAVDGIYLSDHFPLHAAFEWEK